MLTTNDDAGIGLTEALNFMTTSWRFQKILSSCRALSNMQTTGLRRAGKIAWQDSTAAVDHAI